MTLVQTLTPVSGQVTLTKVQSAKGMPLEGLSPLFDGPFDGIDTLTVTDTVVAPSGALSKLSGSVAWRDDPAASIEIDFDAAQITALRLKRKFADGGSPWDLGVTFSSVTEVFSAARDGLGLMFSTVLETSVQFGSVTVGVVAEVLDENRVRLDFGVDNAALGLDDIVHLIGQDAHPAGDLQWLPESLRAGPIARLDRLRLILEPSLSHPVTMAEIDLSFGNAPWPVIPGLAFPTLGSLTAAFMIDHPLEPDLRFAEVTLRGVLRLTDDNTDGTIQVSAHWPNLSLMGRLEPNGTIDFARALSTHGLPTMGDASALVLTKLNITGNPTGKRKRFSLTAEVARPAATGATLSIPLGKTTVLELDDLTFSLMWGSELGQIATIAATLRIIDTATAVQALNEITVSASEDNGAWVFAGRWQGDSVLTVGAWVETFTKTLDADLTLPKWVANFEITSVSVTLDFSSHAMALTIDGASKGTAGSADTSLTLALNVARNPADAWDIHVGGTLRHDPLRFDLTLDHASGTRVIAVLAGDAPVSAGIRDLAGVLGVTLPPAAPNPLLSFQAAVAAFDQPAQVQGQAALPDFNIVAVDLGAGVDLTDLPLIGPMLNAALGDFAVAFQLAYASRQGSTASDEKIITQVNSRLPAGATPLPSAKELHADLNLAAVLKTGDTATRLGLSLTPDPKSGGPTEASSSSGGVPATTPAPSPDGLSWTDINKHFGPVHLRKAGFGLESSPLTLKLGLDAVLSMGPVALAFAGLEIASTLKTTEPYFDPVFSLKGLGLSYSSGGVTLSGSFLHQPPIKPGDPDSYLGTALIATDALTLSAFGEYTDQNGEKSVLVYAVLDRSIGGPSFFFVTGLAAGFGYNRSLKMPPVRQVADFPLVSLAVKGAAAAADPTATMKAAPIPMMDLAALRAAVPILYDEYFFAVGVKFNSFKLIDSFALLAVQFGRSVEIDLLGLSTLVLPPPKVGDLATPIAMVQVALKATYHPDEGVLRVDAVLTDASYLFSRACKLRGGFAFYAWFLDDKTSSSGPKKGDFVVSLGGYHPAFNIAAHPEFPRPERITVTWPVNDLVTVSGDLYCALTPTAIMAGGHISAQFHDGSIQAHFNAGVDFIMMWKPYYYDLWIYVDIGGSYTFEFFGTHTISIDVGASLHIWGPEFSGIATVDLWIVSFDVSFGAGANPDPVPLSWIDFKTAFLPAANQIVSAVIAQGARPASSTGAASVDPSNLRIQIDCAIPATSAVMSQGTIHPPPVGAHPPADVVSTGTGVAPMNVSPGALIATVTLGVTCIPNDPGKPGFDAAHLFKMSGRNKQVPAALWGIAPARMRPGIDTINALPLPDALCGVDLVPLDPDKPGHSQTVLLEHLIDAVDTQTAPTWKMRKCTDPSVLVPVHPPGALKTATDKAIDAVLADLGIATQRGDIFAAFGIDRTTSGAASRVPTFMLAPAVLRNDRVAA